MAFLKRKHPEPEIVAKVIFFLLSIALLLAGMLGDSLGEGGDSTTHYLYAKLSWNNSSYLFNHWAKPLFTALSAPFAQFGMKGMMLFNILCTITAAYLTTLTAKILQFNYYYIAGIVVITMPLLLPVTLSGLTEPLSALLIILAIYLYLNHSFFLSLLIVSFLPFVRSEGLIIVGVFGALLMIEKRWKLIPTLAIGHLFYSLIGWNYYNDILWVFNKIPYATMSSVYGKGNWTHFINQLYFCVQPFTFAMIVISFVYLPIGWIQNKKEMPWSKIFLTYGIAITFIGAHSAFWALGIFNSMGLNRVLVSIFPVCGLLTLQSIHALTNSYKNTKYANRFVLFFTLGILVFPALNNPAATKFHEAIFANKQHTFLGHTLMPYLKQHYPNKQYFFSETEIGLFTGEDIFKKELWLYPGAEVPPKNMQAGDILIFDSLLMAQERNISLEKVRSTNNLIEDTVFTLTNNQNKLTHYHIFIKQ